jgi:hypothetical protein
MECAEETGCSWSLAGRVSSWSRWWMVLIAGGFEEIEEVLPGDILKY